MQFWKHILEHQECSVALRITFNACYMLHRRLRSSRSSSASIPRPNRSAPCASIRNNFIAAHETFRSMSALTFSLGFPNGCHASARLPPRGLPRCPLLGAPGSASKMRARSRSGKFCLKGGEERTQSGYAGSAWLLSFNLGQDRHDFSRGHVYDRAARRRGCL